MVILNVKEKMMPPAFFVRYDADLLANRDDTSPGPRTRPTSTPPAANAAAVEGTEHF